MHRKGPGPDLIRRKTIRPAVRSRTIPNSLPRVAERKYPPTVRQLTAVVAVVTVGLLVAACSGREQRSPASTTTTTSSRPPLAPAALEGLVLSATEIDTTLGVTGMATTDQGTALGDDSDKKWPNGWKWPAECLYAYEAGEGPVYAGSRYGAVRGVFDNAPRDPGSKEVPPSATQVVVLFPSNNEANAFFTASSQSWPACSDHQFTTPSDADSPETVWHVGRLSTSNATLSTTITMTMTGAGLTLTAKCQRALTVRNNVAIDTSACGNDPGDAAVNIANQIAAKVDQQ